MSLVEDRPEPTLPEPTMAAGPRGDGMHDPRRERVRWEGGIGGLVWQSVRNLILGILTFGLYRFWGKAATRRYVWGHVRIGDARASYHGTGLQLLGRWLIVAAALGVPVVAGVLALRRYDLQVAVALQDLGVPFPPEMLPWLPVLPLLALVLLAPALSYWRWRYLLGCTELRGVRFGLDGSMWVYMLRSWLLWAINLGAALLLTPQVVAGQRRYLLRNVTYGALRGRLEKGAMRAPYLRFFIIWLMSAVLLTIVAVYVAGTVKIELAAGGLPDLPKLALPELGRFDAKAALDPQAWARLWSQLLAGLPGENERMVGELYLVLLAPLVGAIVGALVFVRIIGLAHEAAMLRFLTYYFWLGDCGLRSNISFGRLARLRLWNVAILSLSLGALAPWTRHRTFRYVELHTRVGPTAALADAATMPGAVADSDDLVASIEAAIG